MSRTKVKPPSFSHPANERHSSGRLPAAALLTEDGKQKWRPHVWAKEFRRAAEIVNKDATGADRIPLHASTYSFRHARELLQLHGIDPLTVTHQTGTSLQVIEKHYFRFIASAMREKLARVRDGIGVSWLQ